MHAAPAIAQARSRIRLGYLHVVAVDGHIWTGLDRGSFDREGIDFELHEFNTGPEVFEAMARGELDVLSAGGVISNYLALGRGRGFLINDIEVATAQLWGRPTLGRADIAEAFKARKLYSSREWKRLYSDGTVVKWLQQVSDFFMTDAGVTTPVRAADYFDTQLYLATVV